MSEFADREGYVKVNRTEATPGKGVDV